MLRVDKLADDLPHLLGVGERPLRAVARVGGRGRHHGAALAVRRALLSAAGQQRVHVEGGDVA